MKRTLTEKTEAVAVAEPKVGGLASYYDEGWRYGHIEEIDLDDNGEYVLKIRPMGNGRRKKGSKTEFHPPPALTLHVGDYKL